MSGSWKAAALAREGAPKLPPEPAPNWMLISDIDGTLTGDDAALRDLMQLLTEKRDGIGFGVASGRSPALVRQAVAEFGLNEPDLIIASVGTEILGPAGIGERYRAHIDVAWDREAVVTALEGLPGVEPQGEEGQRPFKVSFNAPTSALAPARQALERAGLAVKLLHSHGAFLDVLPARASKGEAVRFVARALDLPLQRVVVAGDSGNDADMLTCGARAVVVGNHDSELLPVLAGTDVYRARGHHAAGVLEGLEHFGAL